MRKIFVFILGLLMPIMMVAQEEVLTNQSIIDMIELGFSNDVIVGKIETSKVSFDTTLDALKTLKEKGVGNEIIISMMRSNKITQEKKIIKNKKNGYFCKSRR